MDDLVFLAKYDRECFEKTCQNVLYNLPESKPLMQKTSEQEESDRAARMAATFPPAYMTPPQKTYSSKDQVETVLARLRKLEAEELLVQNVNAEQVKTLIGSLFMEQLFPHDDRMQYFDMQEGETSIFNKKV